MVIKPLNILGIAGGSSLNGLKAGIFLTDGLDVFATKIFRHIHYPESLFRKIRAIVGKKVTNPEDRILIDETEEEFGNFVLSIIKEIISDSDCRPDAVGLEGPTICHDPKNTYTYQLGKGRLLAKNSKLKIITHFHNADMLNGGIGSPLSASYFAALAQKLEKPAVFINIGGTTTITGVGNLGEIYSFVSGPGTALIDDWMIKHCGMAMDYNGKFAALGHYDEKIVASLMKHDYFFQKPPKYINRDGFNDKTEHLEGLSVEDGAANATAFAAEAVCFSLKNYIPEKPETTILCGGGTQNPTLVRFIRQCLKDLDIFPLTAKEANLEINEAQIAAFLAARRIYSLPLTFPTTTGVPLPVTGGEIYQEDC